MDITVWLHLKAKDVDNPAPAPRKGGFYYMKSLWHTSRSIVFSGDTGRLVWQYMRQRDRAWDLAGVLADRMEECPEECSRPKYLPAIVACLREVFEKRQTDRQLGY